MNSHSLAQEVAGWYVSHVDPYAPNEENVRKYLRGPVLALTLKVLTSPELTSTGLEIESVYEEEKKEKEHGASPWKDYLKRTENEDDHVVWNEQDQGAYDGLGRRTKARMEAFLASCSLALPDMSSSNRKSEEGSKEHSSSSPSKNSTATGKPDLSLSDALAGFRAPYYKQGKNKSGSSSPAIASIQASSSALLRLSSSSVGRLPQLGAADLTMRLELYIRTLTRVRSLKRECVVTAEPPRALKARANLLVTSFVTTVGCVRSIGPSLTRLLQCLSKELFAEDVLGEDLATVIRRLALEYEHETSFASLAFLSSPEVSARNKLTPMILKYLSYLQKNWEQLEAECEMERMLSSVVDSRMRNCLKAIEFRSIGHLLEVCQGFRNELQSIELPPGMGGISSDDVTAMCSDAKVVKQAIRDLHREVVTVNGHVLPPVDSRKELVQLLSQTLNSRNLTASFQKRSLEKSLEISLEAAMRGSDNCPSIVSTFKENADPKADGLEDSSDGFRPSDGYMSSGNDGDTEGSDMAEPPIHNGRKARAKRHPSSFHLSTIDFLTRRLLIASSRTGKGGDAYFIVRDLFGGDDVEVVPSVSMPTTSYGRLSRSACTIEIIVRLASVTIKCLGSFDVYPKALVGECEPLIQLHTTTSETISLQEVRASDSDDNDSTKHSDEDSEGGKFLLQERKTDKTGWRTLTIRPALYERVGVWDTPS